MDKIDDISQLISGHMLDSLSEEQQEELRVWTEQDRHNAELLDRISGLSVSDKYAAYNSISTEAGRARLKRAIRRRVVRRITAAAAAVTVIIGLGAALYGLLPEEKPAGNFSEIPTHTFGATLILGDNSEIAIGEAMYDRDTTLSDGSSVTVKDGRMVYVPSEDAGRENTHSIAIPRGKEYHVTLPDGTDVWLNSDTKMVYPLHFSGTTRRVRLSGEAYFEVAHDASMPFIVETDDQTITVLGTSFNVSAYPDNETVVTTLLRGKVRIDANNSENGTYLTSGQQAILAKGNENITVREVAGEYAGSWRNGEFSFFDDDLASVARALCRWYDCEVSVDSHIMGIKVTGTMDKYQSLEDICRILNHIEGVKFVLSDKLEITPDY